MTLTVGAIRRTLLCVVLALAVPAAAACGGGTAGNAQPAGSSPGGSASAGSAGSAGSSPSGSPGDVLVSYRRQGGIAGVDDSVVVHDDGSYQVSHRGAAPVTGTLPPDRLAALQQAVAAAHLDAVQATAPSKGTADTFVYRLGDGTHEVQLDETAVPPAVTPLITALNGIAGA